MLRRIVLVGLVGLAVGCRPEPRPPWPRELRLDRATFTVKASSIEVRVVRAWRGHEETGLAISHGVTLDFPRMAALVGIAGARAWLAIFSRPVDDAAAKYLAIKQALVELGDEYRYRDGGKYRRSIEDDTGVKLLLAAGLANQGDVAGAAALAQRMLASRLEAYLWRFRGVID